MAVMGLMLYSMAIPATVNTAPNINALRTDIFPDGTGRFFVLSIKASRSFSMIWLKTFDAPTIQYPPMVSRISVAQLKGFSAEKPSRYPATEENTTLIASLALVIAAKSARSDLKETSFSEAFKIIFIGFSKTGAKICQKTYHQKKKSL
jgi:hypothetical protein